MKKYPSERRLIKANEWKLDFTPSLSTTRPRTFMENFVGKCFLLNFFCFSFVCLMLLSELQMFTLWKLPQKHVISSILHRKHRSRFSKHKHLCKLQDKGLRS